MMKGRTYPRRGLHGEVVHDIGLRIVRGELSPGAPLLSDAEPGNVLDVSRTVLREAIKVLAAKGLVVSRPKTGTQVRERRYWNLLDPDVLAWRLEAEPEDGFYAEIFELRRLIEPTAAALAASRATGDEVVELEASWEAMAANAGSDTQAYIAADLRFHELVLASCHNELLAQLGSNLRAVFRASFERTHEAAESTLAQHAAVLAGIRDGNGEAAESAMLELIETTAAMFSPQPS